MSLPPTNFLFYFSAIKTPGGRQILLDIAFCVFFKADYGTVLYLLYQAFFSFLKEEVFFFLSIQSNVKCEILGKTQKSYENQNFFSFSGRKVVCLAFRKGFAHFFAVSS